MRDGETLLQQGDAAFNAGKRARSSQKAAEAAEQETNNTCLSHQS